MPYVVSLVSPGAQDRLFNDATKEHFKDSLATIVALSFNRLTGESLQAGRDSLANDPILDSTLPVDLAVVVLAYWTEKRTSHFAGIYRSIVEDVSKLALGLPPLRIEIHLNVIGQPEPADPNDLPKSLRGNTHCGSAHEGDYYIPPLERP